MCSPMSPKQRFYAALELRPADRVPVFYQHLGAAKWILEYTGLKMYDGFHDPDIFAKLALGAYKLYGYDTVMAGWGDLLIEAQAHGMEWKFPERDSYPRPLKYRPLADADRLSPVEPLKDRFWSVPIRAAEKMVQKVGNEVAVVGCTNAPMLAVYETLRDRGGADGHVHRAGTDRQGIERGHRFNEDVRRGDTARPGWVRCS